MTYAVDKKETLSLLRTKLFVQAFYLLFIVIRKFTFRWKEKKVKTVEMGGTQVEALDSLMQKEGVFYPLESLLSIW